MDIDYVVIGQRIRAARKHRGMTADVLSEKVGLALDSLRHIETAANNPSLQTLYKIAVALNVSLDYITGRTPSITDTLIQGHGLSAEQEETLRDAIDSLIPVIAKHV